MKNTRLIAAAVVLAGFGPATTVALASNGSDDAVRVSAPAVSLASSGGSDDSSRSSTGRDDRGTHRHRNRSRDRDRSRTRDRGRHHRRDDHGGRRGRHTERGDDHGGRRDRDDRVEAGDDHGGRGRGRGGDDD